MCKHWASSITEDTGGTYLLLRFWGRKRSLVHHSTSCLQCVWHSKEFISNMAVSMSSCTCVFKPVTGKVYEVMVNFKANKYTPGGAQRWTWGCPTTPPWEESCVLKISTIAGGLQQNPTPLTVLVLFCITQKGNPWASTQTDRDKWVMHSTWARIWSLHAHTTVSHLSRDACQW